MIRSIAFIHTVAVLVGRFRPRFQAWAELPLVTAGSGIAIGLPQNFDLRDGGVAAARLPIAPGVTGAMRAHPSRRKG